MLLQRYTLPLILTAISVVPATARAEGCIQSSLNGAYGFVSSVRIVPPDPQDRTTRQNVVAVVVYDGAGIVRLAGSVVGVTGVHDILLHGTYQLNEQCLGRVVLLNAKEQKSDTWRFAMVSGGVRLLTVSDSSPNMKPFVQERRWGWAHFVEK